MQKKFNFYFRIVFARLKDFKPSEIFRKILNFDTQQNYPKSMIVYIIWKQTHVDIFSKNLNYVA